MTVWLHLLQARMVFGTLWQRRRLMFSTSELTECISQSWFSSGYAQLERNLLLARLGSIYEPLSSASQTKMKRFSQAVIGSAPTWNNPQRVTGGGFANWQPILKHPSPFQRRKALLITATWRSLNPLCCMIWRGCRALALRSQFATDFDPRLRRV